MEVHLIEHNSQQWMFLLLLGSVFALAIVKYVANVQLAPALNNLLQIKSFDALQNQMHPFVKALFLFNYAVIVSLLIAMLMTIDQKSMTLDFLDYLPVLILTISFLLIKRYLNLFLASLLGFLDLMQFMELYRDRARMLTGIPLLIGALIWLILSGAYDLEWWISLSSIFVILPLFIIRVILGVKELYTSQLFYFIVYLCALEIGPYLLLYKYFIA